jgi:hypothetical protein
MTGLGGMVGVADAMVGLTEVGITAVFRREAVRTALEEPGVVTELGEEVTPSADSILVVVGLEEMLLTVDSDGIGTEVEAKVLNCELRVLE